MKRWRNYGVVALIVVILITIFQNTDTVNTKILFITVSMPRFLLLLITFLIGLGLGYLGASRRGNKKKEAA